MARSKLRPCRLGPDKYLRQNSYYVAVSIYQILYAYTKLFSMKHLKILPSLKGVFLIFLGYMHGSLS
jgi:hypothetical protein